MKTRTILFLSLAGLWLIAGQASALGAEATGVVKKILDDVMAIQSNPSLQGQASRPTRRAAIKKVIVNNFDFDDMARQALGPYWNGLDGPGRAEFKSVFQDLFLDSYSRLVLDFLKKEKVAYVSEEATGNGAKVKTLIQRTDEEIPVDYFLIPSPGTLKVRDVSVDGVSIVGNYLKTFARVIQREAYQGLLRKMKLQRQAAEKTP
jgi:phospholipid transport system substrate-binding protein